MNHQLQRNENKNGPNEKQPASMSSQEQNPKILQGTTQTQKNLTAKMRKNVKKYLLLKTVHATHATN